MKTLNVLAAGTLAMSILLVARAAPAPSPAIKISAEARAIHDSAIIVDTHADTTQRLLDENFDLATVTPVSDGHLDFEKIREGNLAAEFFSIWVDPQRIPREQYAHRTLALIDSVYRQADKHPERMTMAFSVSDIMNARKSRKFAALMGIEGGHSIENDLGLLRNFYRLGVRYMTLTWSNTNEWADSSGDIDKREIKHHNGLTDFGKQVVAEMNRLGMMVDISHVSDKTFWDTIATTKAPVIASHSSARALDSHARNMTDDMLKAVGKNGGVVMVNYFSAFIDENYRKAYAAQKDERDAAIRAIDDRYRNADIATRYRMHDRAEKEWAARIPRPPFRALVDHVDHIAKTAGIDHVGLGSDFDGVSSLPQDIDSTADLPKITQALVERGYNREQIHKILGGNILRVFADVERVSREMKK
jgi:membrane dipeptidase